MTNEEMQRAMDFILKMEAKSSATIDALAEAQKQADNRWHDADERWVRADERWARTEESIRALLTIAQVHEKEIQANAQQILSLGQQTSATDEPLNALINVVERQIGKGRNGKP
jgi:hypothetical protein